MRRAYTFDEVALVPQFNNVPSRTEPSLESWLTRKLKVGMPLLASNMESVIGEPLAEVLLANGSMPIFHRFTDRQRQQDWVRRFGARTFVSAGLQDINDIQTVAGLTVGVSVVGVLPDDGSPAFSLGVLSINAGAKTITLASNLSAPLSDGSLVFAVAEAGRLPVGADTKEWRSESALFAGAPGGPVLLQLDGTNASNIDVCGGVFA